MSANAETGRGDAATAEHDRQHVRVHPAVRLFVWAAFIALVLFFLDTIAPLVLLLIGAGALAATLAPLRHWLPGPLWLRGTAVGIGFLAIVAAGVALLGLLVWDGAINDMNLLADLSETTDRSIRKWLDAIGLEEEITVRGIHQQALAWLTGGDGSMIGAFASNAGDVVVAVALIVFGMLYMLGSEHRRTIDRLEALLPCADRAIEQAMDDLARRLRQWAVGTMISMAVTGLLTGIGLWIIGLKMAITLAVLAGLAEVVPTLGPLVVFIIALLVANTQGTTELIGVLVLWGIVQTVEGYVIFPLVLRGAVRIPPLITLFTIILWGRLFGVLGILLAVPLDLTIWTLVDRLYLQPKAAKRTHAIDEAAQSAMRESPPAAP